MPKLETCRQAIQRDIRKNLRNNQENGKWIVDTEIGIRIAEDGTFSYLEFDEETGDETTHTFEVVLVHRTSTKEC